MHIINFRKIVRLSRRSLWPWALVGILLVAYIAAYALGSGHPLGVDGHNPVLIRKMSTLRYQTLVFFTQSIWTKLLAFVLMAYALLSLMVTRLRKREHYLLYSFTVLSAVPFLLIDQRYYIAGFALFLLFRKPESKKVEYALLCYFIAMSLLFLYVLRSTRFFL